MTRGVHAGGTDAGLKRSGGLAGAVAAGASQWRPVEERVAVGCCAGVLGMAEPRKVGGWGKGTVGGVLDQSEARWTDG
jgi:hypothetical protein